MLSARVTDNIIMPSYHPMIEDMVLNATANMGVAYCASRPAVHSNPLLQ